MRKERRGIETRAYPRVVSYHPVKYRILEKGGSKRKREASAKNISGSGILFRTNKEIPVSAILELEIAFPSLPNPIKTLAKVVRVVKTKAGGYEIGAYYLKIDEGERDELIRKIDFVLREMKERESIWKRIQRWWRRS